MPLLLRRLAGAAAAPLRRSLGTAASRPPWAPAYRMAPLGATRAPSTGARASFHLNENEAPCASHLPLVTTDLASASIQAASRDRLLFLDFVDTRHRPLGVRRFVCNLVSGQLFRHPDPSMDAALTTTPFGLLTQSDASPFADGIGFTIRAVSRDGLLDFSDTCRCPAGICNSCASGAMSHDGLLDFSDTRGCPAGICNCCGSPASGVMRHDGLLDFSDTRRCPAGICNCCGSPASGVMRHDGLLDFSDTRRCPAGICNCCGSPASGAMSHDRERLFICAETRHAGIGNCCDSPGLAACAAAIEPGVRRFVCNPLSGELFLLPVPDASTTPFGPTACIRAASRDELLFLDIADTRRCLAAICNCCCSPGSAGGGPMSHDVLLLRAGTRHVACCDSPGLAPRAAPVEPGVSRFVYKPLSGQLFRLPDLHSCIPAHFFRQRWYSHPPRPSGHHNFSTIAAPPDADPCMLPFWWWPPDKRKSVWSHVVGQGEEGQRLHPFAFVTKFPPVESVEVFGEYGRTDKTNKTGQGIISSFIVRLAVMKQDDISFYDPVTVDSFSIDQYGRVQIADGVLLRRASKTSSAIDTLLAADALDQILSHGHKRPIELPEVHDLLQQMRSPWRLHHDYALLIHTSAMPEQIRGHALSNAFELLMNSMTEDERNIVLSKVWAGGWGEDAQGNLVLAQYYYYRDSQFDPDDPEKQLVYCRNSESHILSYLEKLKKMRLSYTKEDHQRLMHAKFWELLCQIYQILWEHRMFKWARPEDHLCGGACCPLTSGCVRNRCFLKDVRDKSMPCDEWANTCLRIAHRIQKKNAKVYNSYLIEARYGVGDPDLECTDIVRKVIHYTQPNKVCPAAKIYFKVLDAPYSFKAWNDLQLSVTKGELLEVRYKHGPWTFVKKVGPCVGRRAGLVPSRFFQYRLWF